MEPPELVSESSTTHDNRQPNTPGNGDGNEDPNRKKPVVRKRTKTGCITCRKRRIKCDEGRPTCANCIKSKRQCDGYNQRVVFKEPMGAFGGSFGTMEYPPDSHAFVNQVAPSPSRAGSSSNSSHQLIAPKPTSSADFQGQTYGDMGPPSTTDGFNFNEPYVAHGLPPTPLGVSSSPFPHGVDFPASFQWNNMGAQNVDQLTPSSRFSSSARDSASTGIDAHERILRRPYDPDILVEDEADDQDMFQSDGEGEESGGDFEMDMDPGEQMKKRSTFGALIGGRLVPHNEIHETRMRTFSAYAQGTTLSTYVPAAGHSLPTDPQTMAVFRHFVFVTGPSMSLYERHPFDHSKVSPDQLVPQVNQNIWTYTFPMLSLNHPALLQAMLALGALQIANLQRNPPTAAMKHYHLAIRKIAKCVRSSTQRAHPATLAATLLLGYFEVWSSDHTKWCRHLYGARILFRDVPFRHMTRVVLPAKRRRRQRFEQDNIQDPFNPWLDYSAVDTGAPGLDEVDVEFLSTITGRKLEAEDYGYGVDLDSLPRTSLPTDRDIEYYEHLRDLFWWNCKMDIYQSILGATRLFMRLDEWLPCPPRAPAGRLDAIYGTFDHLLLLMGRLSEFVSDDLPRKKKANKPPGPRGASPPMFPGMFPSRGKVCAPKGFSPPRDASPQSEGFDENDIDAATETALARWHAIRQAFEAFRAQLGPEFQPLADEYSDRKDTPFGPAIQYRTFSVAGIWMNFNMGLICLYRAHPSMPPAAMMAAGRAARDTAPMAREIGRIAAGLSDEISTVTEISTLVGAAFIESSFCLFVAGIQFQDSAQRHWLIQRLHDISRLTGWGSARQIAEGCEASWVRAAHMGRGPPYARSADLNTGAPLTVWSNPRRIDRRIQELEEGGEVVLAKADRAHLALGLLGVDGDLDRLKLVDD
ncbi:hypothetical protein jhhlp_003516 [Lomentospora prolificans]|uniref:Zn(2)-C6 fungal-type domain-containing protein n=1 Tax=Lomentospora prolificans TaxID=41688 RepID=A0A2N3N8Y1_9PEZI|nr:hypothetical protein jhhlp_003516 [Lomentospora prolificans]